MEIVGTRDEEISKMSFLGDERGGEREKRNRKRLLLHCALCMINLYFLILSFPFGLLDKE